ncbi:amino acid adenylation domain-containing protein [Melissospora conviva]|uniref:amino acid adenylation domain-containing protein n=1 Tax=Melissospora conviva TaxID=3388432 RepID=UPI003C1B5884
MSEPDDSAAAKRARLARLLTTRNARPRRYPPSYGQQRLWFLDRFQPGNPVYNIPVAYRVDGPLDVAALREALRLVVARHDTLRTTFAEVAGEPVQVVNPGLSCELDLVEPDGPDLAGRRLSAVELVRAEARAPFDLAAGPLLRARLIRVAAEEHYLSLCLHHCICDAWSLSVLFAELRAAYAALRAGTPPTLDPLPAQYADFARWQREKLSEETLHRQLDYWSGQLTGAPALLTLPTDRPRPAIASYRGQVHYFTLDAPLARRLRRFSQEQGVTMFMTLLAGFAALLSRYSGQDDVVVGTPIAGRSHPDLEPLIGFFVNTLALRIRTDGAPDFRTVLGRAKEAVLGGLANADLPFEKLVEQLRPERSMSHAPVFQTQLIVLNTPQGALDLAGTRVASLHVDSGTAKFDLSLVAEVGGEDAMRLAMEYDTALFDAATVERFGRHLRTLLEAAVADPGRQVAEIGLLSDAERWQTVLDWNATGCELPPAATALDLIEAAQELGDSTVTGPDGTVTGRRLLEDAARLATLLRRRGVAPDTPVGICLDRGVRMLGAVLGSWHAGAGYLPLDPALPAERLRYMLQDSGARVVVTRRAVRDKLAGTLATAPVLICLDDDAAELTAAPADTPAEPMHPDSLAYLIYTSGSTGRPKGVAVPHRGVVNLLAAFGDELGLTPADRFAAVTTLSFDISVLELLLPLVSGAQLVIVASAVAGDGAALRRLLAEEGVTAMQATPATWRLLLAAGGTPAALRVRLCGGEALPRDLADALAADGAALWNCYGPTETTVWSTTTRTTGTGLVDLGPPIANTEIYLLDAAGRPVPPGIVGEVHIGGYGVVRGYHGSAGRTAGVFVPDPFGDRPGARLYATGDLARRRADGRLEFLGRADHQVKVRGFRVELGEIEETLRAHRRVADAVVTTWSAGPEDVRLVGYLVPAGDEPADGLHEQLREWLASRLPAYLIPSVLMLLPALPLNANGKTDRGALPPPDWRAAAGAEPVAPRTPVEEVLAEVWQEVLGVARVGADDNFFALGGHSLLATRALGRLAEIFEMEVPIRLLFETPTVAGLAAALTRAEPTPGHVESVARLRRELAGLSTEELQALLASAEPTSGEGAPR